MDERALQDLQAGFRMQQDGSPELAAARYQQVLDRFPENEFALNLMGVLCVRRGKFQEAIEFLQKALAVNALDPETHNNLGLAYKGIHEFGEARQAFEKSLGIKPGQPAVLNNMGNSLASLNNHRQAIKCFESALSQDPAYVDCLSNLCMSLLAERQFSMALKAIGKAIDLDPNRSISLNNKGRVLTAMLRFAEAAECFEAAVALDANLTEARIHLSTALKQLRKEELAKTTLNQALHIEPDNPEAHNCLGVLLEQTGDFSGAAQHFRQAIRCSPNYASAYYQLSKLSGQQLTEEERQQILQLLDDGRTHAHLRGSLLFALASDLEKRQEFAASLSYLVQGNEARSNQTRYDSGADDAYYAAVRSTFPVRVDNGPLQPGGFLPVFVLGMPRSGTTLTEQILASHTRIAGAGESGALGDLARRASELVNRPFPQCCQTLSVENIRALRTEYFFAITELVGSWEYVVDKTPMNYQLIGLIATLFPEGRIIFCKRGALDNCLSIFKLPFDEHQSYSHDLDSLGRYYRNHERLMQFWHQCYPNRILTAEYEQTIDEIERQARRLLEFIGARFEDGVLRFYDNERMILTPSAQQVRRPIYRSSVNTWQKYGDGLQPLVRALAG